MITTNHPALHACHFVVSAPRSGSTWLANALNHHPDILATENRLLGPFFDVWKNARGEPTPRITVDEFANVFARHSFFKELGFESASEMGVDLFNEFAEFLMRYLRKRSGKPVIVDKITPYLGTADRVVMLTGLRWSSRMVHLIRDGRDVAVSGVFDWITRERETSDRYKLFVENDPNVRLTRFFDEALLQRWTSYWNEPIEAFQRHSPESVLEVRYEAMLENQAKVLDSIFQHFHVAQRPELATACVQAASFQQTTGRKSGQAAPLKKARKGIAGDWQNFFTRHDAARFQELTGDMLQELGYEPDQSWIEKCPEKLDLHIGN